MDSYDKISDSLNTTFVTSGDESLVSLEKELVAFEEKKHELQEFVSKKKELTLDDANWLQLETKTLYLNARMVLDKLQTEIKQGSSPRMYEVYSQLLSTAMTGLKELRELNRLILEIARHNASISDAKNPGGTVNVFVGNSKDMLEMVKRAREANSLNSIDGTFQDVKE